MSHKLANASVSSVPSLSHSVKNRGDDDDADSSDDDKSSKPYQTDPKGDEFMKKAQQKMKGGLFNSLFHGADKYENAIELFEKAAAHYKMNKNWQEAGEACQACAEISLNKLNSTHDAAVAYEHAAKSYNHVNSTGQRISPKHTKETHTAEFQAQCCCGRCV